MFVMIGREKERWRAHLHRIATWMLAMVLGF
jgi:hypothetical protein